MSEVSPKSKPLSQVSICTFLLLFTSGMTIFKHTPMNSAGTVATTARANVIEMITGGFLGSDRKMWWISASLPYRSGFGGTSTVATGSSLTLKSKTGVTKPWDEPKDATIRLAERGPSERSS